MDDVKNRMYNYEITPPQGVWEAISSELDTSEARVIPITKKKNNIFYYVAAASVVVIFFCFIFFNNRSSKQDDRSLTSSPGETQKDNVIMTVPIEEKTTRQNNELHPKHKVQKEEAYHEQNKHVNSKDSAERQMASNSPRYITIEGSEGQPVKISSKMATLIDSSETKIATKPIWNKKINEWREIMKGNTLAPTPGNFLDIVELTKSLRRNK